MRGLFRPIGWLFGTFLMLAFFGALFASLYVRDAIRHGALAQQVYGCVEEQHADRIEDFVDRALVRAIQKHYAEKTDGPGSHHLRGAIAYVGVKLLYSEERRKGLIMTNLKSTPLCPPRDI